MPKELTHEREVPAAGTGRRLGYLLACFSVGCFAGALASFFPRLMAIIAGDPNENVHVFSTAYLLVGCAIAVIVGLVILITDSDAERKLKDVFLSALGIPTLLMGTISTTATSTNVVAMQQQLERTVAAFQSAANVPTLEGNASIPASLAEPARTSWEIYDILISPAYAQNAYLQMPAKGSQNGLGITANQGNYVVVYGSAPSGPELAQLQAALRAKGIASLVQPGSRGDYLLVPSDGAVKPYSDAVHAAILAQAAGARPYVVALRNAAAN
jgi:hypothetical protein